MNNIKTEASRTEDEFRDLKYNSKAAPSTAASTGQPLTCMYTEESCLLEQWHL